MIAELMGVGGQRYLQSLSKSVTWEMDLPNLVQDVFLPNDVRRCFFGLLALVLSHPRCARLHQRLVQKKSNFEWIQPLTPTKGAAANRSKRCKE